MSEDPKMTLPAYNEIVLPEVAMYKPFFDLVAPKDNWKKAINTVVAAPTSPTAYGTWVRVMTEAIEFFAGGDAKVTIVEEEPFSDVPHALGPKSRKVRVTAPGYYAMVGA